MTATIKASSPSLLSKNQAAHLIGRVLQVKRPIQRELQEYSSLEEAVVTLRRVSGLSQVDMAARLAISVQHLSNTESAYQGNIPHNSTIERFREMASQCYLPRMVEFFDRILLLQKDRPQKGRKQRTNNPWEKWDIATTRIE